MHLDRLGIVGFALACATSTAQAGGVCDPSADILGVFRDAPAHIAIIDANAGTAAPAPGLGAGLGLDGVTATALFPTQRRLLLATGEGDDSLYSMHLDDGSVDFHGPFIATDPYGKPKDVRNVQAMDVAPPRALLHGFTGNHLYAISIDSIRGMCDDNCLFEVDPKSGRADLVARLPLEQARGMSFDPLTGELWIYDAGPRRLFRVDGGGTVTAGPFVETANQGNRRGVSTAFSLTHTCDGRMFLVDVSFGTLTQIDPATGAAWWVSDMGDMDGPGGVELHGLDGGLSRVE